MTDAGGYALLHGGGQGSWVWEPLVGALAAQGCAEPVLRLDVPGCGTKRDHPDPTLDPRAIARVLAAEVEAAGLRDVLLVGHSQAGQVLPFMAAAAPGLFRRLVYISCSIPAPGQSVMELIGTRRAGTRDDEIGWPYDPAATDPAEGFRLMFCNDMDEPQQARFAAQLGQDAWPAATYAYTDWLLPERRVPASFVLCLRDAILPLPWQERFADRFGADRRVRVDCGHQAMTTRPHALAEILQLEAAA